MLDIFAKTFFTAAGLHDTPHEEARTRHARHLRAIEARRKADDDFLRQYGNRHF